MVLNLKFLLIEFNPESEAENELEKCGSNSYGLGRVETEVNTTGFCRLKLNDLMSPNVVAVTCKGDI